MFAEHQVGIYLTLRLRFRLRLGLASATRRYTFQNASAARKDRGYEVLRETTYQPRTSEDQKNLFRWSDQPKCVSHSKKWLSAFRMFYLAPLEETFPVEFVDD